MPLSINKLKNAYFTGTCCATASTPAASKKTVPEDFKGATGLMGVINGLAAYLHGGSDWDRVGWNVTATEVAFNAATVSAVRVIMLTDTLGIIGYIVSTKLYGIAFTIGDGGALTFGTAVTVNDADTGALYGLCRISATQYCFAYVDDGGDDYLCARMGTVATRTITQGTEKVLVEAACGAKDDRVSVCQPRSGVIAVAAPNVSAYGTVIAATFSGTTIATPGTAVTFNGNNATTEAAICSHFEGKIAVAYADVSTGYLTLNIGTVSAAAVVAFAGSEEALNASATTCVRCFSPRTNSIVVAGIDANADVNIIAGGVIAGALTTFVQGATITITATATIMGITSISPTEIVVGYCDDAQAGDYGSVLRYTCTWAATGAGTLVADSIMDYLMEASCKSELDIAGCTNGKIVAAYKDVGNSNYGTANTAEFRDDIIDIRSTTASDTFSLYLFPYYEYRKTN